MQISDIGEGTLGVIVCGVVIECGNKVTLEKNVFQRLYPYHKINWCIKIDVECEGGQ